MFGYLLKSKDEMPKIFKEFMIFAERESDEKIKILRSDRGTEFCKLTNRLFPERKWD